MQSGCRRSPEAALCPPRDSGGGSQAGPATVLRTVLRALLRAAVLGLVAAVAAPVHAPAQDFVEVPTATLLSRAETLLPVEMYVLAARLFADGRRDEAVRWLYVAQIRARLHLATSRGLRPDAEPALYAALNEEVGRPINEWAFGDVDALALRMQEALDPDRLVFLDETAAATNMTRRYGWAPRGQRCRIAVPQGHYKTTTVTAALRADGLCAIDSADGATNGGRFRAYVADTLAPVLRPGDTVILDNLAAHKVVGVREAVEAAGARVLYLPPYSPDFNPIEQIFAKLKRLLRTAAARTVPDLWVDIRQALTRVTAQECRNCLTAAGYADDVAVAT